MMKMVIQDLRFVLKLIVTLGLITHVEEWIHAVTVNPKIFIKFNFTTKKSLFMVQIHEQYIEGSLSLVQ